MRTSRVVMSLAGWLLVILCVVAAQPPQKPAQPPPPPPVRDVVDLSELCRAYETDPVKADKAYKWRILEVHDVGFLPWTKGLFQDSKGRKYVSIAGSQTWKPNEYREIARCYLRLPDRPIVEEVLGANVFGVKGLCTGTQGGVVILEHCTVFTYFDLPGGW
jgi:hypothetical protein